MRVLVVEDQPKMQALLSEGLHEAGFAVDEAGDGPGGLQEARSGAYDAVLLDVMLPGFDGFEVLRRLRAEGVWTPVLVLTARDAVPDRVLALDVGADDYLAKPFAFAELVARIRALARRAGTALPPVIERGTLRLDPARRVASRNGDFLRLTNKELAVLEVLLAADGAVVSAEELLERAWDEHADPFTNAVRVMMVKLRRKLGNPPLIETLPGAGYRIP